jgi:fructose-1,6-bisphosphatase/inositol monophosphatase family enzyme
VLCEEAGNSNLSDIAPGVDILPWGDDVADLPPMFMSVDGLDGSALFANGELELTAISAALISDSKPAAAIVLRLSDLEMYLVDHRDGHTQVMLDHSPEPRRPLCECLIGLDDCKAVDSRYRELVVNKLTSSRGTRYPLNVPSCAGGLKVLEGKLASYVTSNARHWDLAGVAALCEAAGMIVRCLDGSPVPWNCVRMPPVVFARDEEAFAYVNNLTHEYWQRAESVDETFSRGVNPSDWG